MQTILDQLQKLDLHPVADHFTIALLIVAVVLDLIAGMAPARQWLRYSALTLLILGALSAGASYATGDMEADRVWKAIGPEARDVLHWHAEIAEYLAVVFGVLALWRILIEAVGFFRGSRPVYMIITLIAAGTLLYVGRLGGELVYDYGVGTALMSAAPVPNEAAAATPQPSPAPNMSLPTVSVPTATPAPAASAAAPPAAAPSSAAAAPAEPKASKPVESPKAAPSGSPSPSSGDDDKI